MTAAETATALTDIIHLATMNTAKNVTLLTCTGRAQTPGRDPTPPSATAKTIESERESERETSTEKEESDRTAGH